MREGELEEEELEEEELEEQQQGEEEEEQRQGEEEQEERQQEEEEGRQRRDQGALAEEQGIHGLIGRARRSELARRGRGLGGALRFHGCCKHTWRHTVRKRSQLRRRKSVNVKQILDLQDDE